MSQTATAPLFGRRFDQLRRAMLRVQTSRALTRALFVALSAFALLALADYAWELPVVLRQIGLTGLGLASLGLGMLGVARALREWNRPRTAAEVEQYFPELGQSIRTTVQFAGQDAGKVEAAGARSTLVSALEREVDTQTEGVDFDSIVPRRRLRLAGSAVGGIALFVFGAALLNPEWNTAVKRTLLADEPYTRLAVTPGDLRIEAGQEALIGIELSGRTARTVKLLTREAGNESAEWQEQKLDPEDAVENRTGFLRHEVTLARLEQPLDYRVVAGHIVSDDFHIGILYPLELKHIEVDVTPPEYTGLPTQTIGEGHVHALEGTRATFRIELDRAPVRAEMIATPTAQAADDAEPREPLVIPLSIEGSVLTATMELTEELSYTIQAQDSDGMTLPENRHRIRIRKDQPPQVWFEEPSEALEVHTLAEVLMRIRLRDDFGLTRAGIVFQVNNEDEHTLLLHDFAEESSDNEERRPPTTDGTLSRMLPLEHFELTQKDSVAYYAFAEDNFPGGARRTETDLRFVDIRPFKRTYSLSDPPPPSDGMGGKPLASLEELIGRQRFALNRALQLVRRPPASGQSELGTVNRLVEFESQLATSTRELAEFLEFRNVPGNDLLFQAEEVMLAAVDSLSAGKYDVAVLQEKDALRYLVDARNTLAVAIAKMSPRDKAELRQFDRKQTQKLRRPKNDEEAEEIASRLRELAAQEEFVYQTLSGIKMDAPMKSAGAGGGGSSGKPDDQEEKQEEEQEKSNSSPTESQTSKGEEQPKPESAGKEDSAEEGEGESQGKPAQGITRAELEQKQADIAAEAQELQKLLEKQEGLTDLAKARAGEALKEAEAASAAMSRGQNEEAEKSTQKAAGMFRELATHVEGLLAKEAAQRIAAARSVADQLSEQEREFAEEVSKSQSSGNEESQSSGSGQKQSKRQDSSSGGESGEMPETPEEKEARALAGRAASMAESARTLEDILKAMTRSTDPADQDAIRQVQEVLSQDKVSETVERTQRQAAAMGKGKADDAEQEAREIADRYEGTARRLEGIHRSLVAPQIASLIKLEEQVARLQEELSRLETDNQVSEWHRLADEVLQQLEDRDLSEEAREELKDAMRAAGWNGDLPNNKRWQWGRNGDYYGAPLAYHRSSRKLAEELHALIQELILGDLQQAGDEPAPQQFERLIERYYQVLSSAPSES